MNGQVEEILPIDGARLPRRNSGANPYWTGFTICLFMVLLSVFTWVVHRRLTQYEPLQQAGGHRMTATKVCLTDRNQISLPTAQGLDESGILLTAIVLASTPVRGDDSPQASIDCEQPRQLCRSRSKPCLAHFFFLPPPPPRLSL